MMAIACHETICISDYSSPNECAVRDPLQVMNSANEMEYSLFRSAQLPINTVNDEGSISMDSYRVEYRLLSHE